MVIIVLNDNVVVKSRAAFRGHRPEQELIDDVFYAMSCSPGAE